MSSHNNVGGKTHSALRTAQFFYRKHILKGCLQYPTLISFGKASHTKGSYKWIKCGWAQKYSKLSVRCSWGWPPQTGASFISVPWKKLTWSFVTSNNLLKNKPLIPSAASQCPITYTRNAWWLFYPGKCLSSWQKKKQREEGKTGQHSLFPCLPCAPLLFGLCLGSAPSLLKVSLNGEKWNPPQNFQDQMN